MPGKRMEQMNHKAAVNTEPARTLAETYIIYCKRIAEFTRETIPDYKGDRARQEALLTKAEIYETLAAHPDIAPCKIHGWIGGKAGEILGGELIDLSFLQDICFPGKQE